MIIFFTESISSNFSVSVPYNSDVTQTNSDVIMQQDLQLVIQPHRVVTSHSIVASSEDQSTEDEQTPTNQSQKSSNNQHFQHSGLIYKIFKFLKNKINYNNFTNEFRNNVYNNFFINKMIIIPFAKKQQ